jgi:enoyl-CoA hydratase
MVNLVERRDEGGAATLILNRPEKLNALTVSMFEALRAHVDAIERQNDTIGVVVIRGAGKCFSAGHDLADLAEGEHPPIPHFQAETIAHLANLPQPVITAVHGHCYTGALELALAGDLIVAAQSARFSDTHAKWAVAPYWGMTQRLPRRVGLVKAKEMMLTCRTYSGEQAAAFGLANWCVPDERFDDEISNLTQTILAQSWFTHRANKKALRETDGIPLAAGLAYEICQNEGMVGPDMQDRIEKFSQRKRT